MSDNEYKVRCNTDTTGKTCVFNRKCDDDKFLINCGGGRKELASGFESQKRHPTENTCINSCGENAYYNETALSRCYSYYNEEIRLCVCEEGFKLYPNLDETKCERIAVECNYQYNSKDENSFYLPIVL